MRHLGAGTASDVSNCQKAEECLERARRARTKDERLEWYVLAGAWIDRCRGKPLTQRLRRLALTQANTVPRQS
jgi:hypothetical protein